jgi:hypothetical protein
VKQVEMEIVIEPHVAASLLDHYQGKLAKNCRGWLIGTASPHVATVTNFVPDSFNRPVGKANAKESQQYSANLQKWFEAIKAMFPRETTVIGMYSVGSGAVVVHSTKNENTETIMEIPYDSWSTEYIVNPYFGKRGEAIHVDVRIPTPMNPTLRFLGKRYTCKIGSAPLPTEVPVRLIPETSAANTVLDHIIRLAYGEHVEETSVQVLDLDRVLAELPSEANVTDTIRQVFASLENSVAKVKAGDKVSQLLTALKEQQAEAATANSESFSEVRMRNALMIKLVVTRLQEYLRVLEHSMVSGPQRGRFDRR